MEAVKSEHTQQWRVTGGQDIEADGVAGTQELTNACANMWAMALGWYYRDASAALRGLRQVPDGGAALDDLTGSRELLSNLCKPIDADPQRIGDAMLAALDTGRKFEPGQMNRVVPEIHERYGPERGRKMSTPWR